ncbi:hypothetical protein WH240_15400 [Gluconobacter wancherniae]|uniref:hypothetical protein n=1 Tax=Gluconobacter wancherniae TaxID=1307955 RepID=UPI00309FD5AB
MLIMERNVVGVDAGSVYPTVERFQHSELRRIGDAYRVVNTVQAMYDAQDIGDDEVAAADRWYREFLFATVGVVEQRPNAVASHEKGDVHTWMLGRGKCSVRINDVRHAMGLCAHVRLEMMLAREMSFSAMARQFYPGLSEARARMKISAQCALILEQLASFYENDRINKK